MVLCDISGSIEPYARATLHLLYRAAGAARAEVFTFATRLTRLTRIGAALKDFIDRYGRRGTARGAVVSAHSLTALDDLLAALAETRR